MSATAICSLESARRKFFMNETFLISRGRNEPNRLLLPGIGEKKIFHELEVHHV